MAQQAPPWLQEQIKQYQMTQSQMQAMASQQQSLEMEKITVERALEEVRKAAEGEVMYRQAGPVLIRTEKPDVVSDLEERLELSKTQATVLEKQMRRLNKKFQEQEAKIQAALQGGAASPPGS